MITNFLKLFTLVFTLSFVLTSCNKDQDLLPTPNPTPDAEQVSPPATDKSAQINALVNTSVSDSVACYEFTFPLTFVYEDGATVTAASEEDLEEIFSAAPYPWDIAFPVNLIDPETGETVTAADEEELFAYFAECEDFEDDWEDDEWEDDCDFELGSIGCYDFVFPVTFALEGGDTIAVSSSEELEEILVSGAEINDFVYPVNLTRIETGTSHTANSGAELDDLLEECEEEDYDEEGAIIYLLSMTALNNQDSVSLCYQYIYPVSVIDTYGDVLTAENEEEMYSDIFINNDGELVDFVYPVQLTDNETGETLIANNADEAFELVEACEDE